MPETIRPSDSQVPVREAWRQTSGTVAGPGDRIERAPGPYREQGSARPVDEIPAASVGTGHITPNPPAFIPSVSWGNEDATPSAKHSVARTASHPPPQDHSRGWGTNAPSLHRSVTEESVPRPTFTIWQPPNREHNTHSASGPVRPALANAYTLPGRLASALPPRLGAAPETVPAYRPGARLGRSTHGPETFPPRRETASRQARLGQSSDPGHIPMSTQSPSYVAGQDYQTFSGAHPHFIVEAAPNADPRRPYSEALLQATPKAPSIAFVRDSDLTETGPQRAMHHNSSGEDFS